MLHLYLELPSWAFLERMVSYFTHLTESTRSSYILGVLDLLASLDSLWEVAEASMPGLAFGLVGLMEAPSLALRLAIVARFAPPNSFIDGNLDGEGQSPPALCDDPLHRRGSPYTQASA